MVKEYFPILHLGHRDNKHPTTRLCSLLPVRQTTLLLSFHHPKNGSHGDPALLFHPIYLAHLPRALATIQRKHVVGRMEVWLIVVFAPNGRPQDKSLRSVIRG